MRENEMQGSSTIGWSGKDSKRPGFVQQSGEDSSAGAISPTLLRKVLVVDDEHDLADMAAALLSAHGLEVLVAYSGHAALQLLANDTEIDAVFSDVVMPGMTGLQMADAIREMYPGVKLVLASGYTLPELLSNRERPYLFTSKPYKIETILKLLLT
jgi:two-component system OmpR family response regulator